MKATLHQNDANQNGFNFIVTINFTFYKMSKYKVINSLFIQKKFKQVYCFYLRLNKVNC